MWRLGEETHSSALVPWKGKEREPSFDARSVVPRKGFVALMQKWWSAIRGYTVEDIDRLKEGGVQQVEGKGRLAIAEAEAKLAEAAKLHAESEKYKAEAYHIRKAADRDMLSAQVEAFERFEAAISRIKQQGGEVAFSSEEIKSLIQLTNSHLVAQEGQTEKI
jgi:hypothetical protein